MKIKVSYVLMILLVGFIFVNNVFAANELQFELTAKADKNMVVAGTEATITVSLKSGSYINGCSFNISSSNTIVGVSKSGLNGYEIIEQGNSVNVEKGALSGDALTNGIEIMTLKYKINGDGKVTIKTEECISPLTEDTGSYKDVVINFATATDNTLSYLYVNNGSAFAFDPERYEYAVSLSKPNFSIDMFTSDSSLMDYVVVLDGEENTLNPKNIAFVDESGIGTMEIKIIVNGDIDNPYKLALTYKNESLDGSLKSLTLNGVPIALTKGVLNYTYTVGRNVTKINVAAVLNDSDNFQFVDELAPGEYSMPIDKDTLVIPISIKAKDAQSGGQSVEYQIEVVREKDGSSSSSNKPSVPSSSKPSSTGGNVSNNPATGGISKFLMASMLLASLIVSIILYKKNMESYK